jgi:hypothetical protein
MRLAVILNIRAAAGHLHMQEEHALRGAGHMRAGVLCDGRI